MPTTSQSSPVRFHVLRLLPGQEVLSELQQWLSQHQINAAFIASAVGSLSVAQLRFAAQEDTTTITDAFEVHALSGTLDPLASHLHLSLSNPQGQMTGGHLMPGCIVRTTLELVIGELTELNFERRHCDLSGYLELHTSTKPIYSPKQS